MEHDTHTQDDVHSHDVHGSSDSQRVPDERQGTHGLPGRHSHAHATGSTHEHAGDEGHGAHEAHEGHLTPDGAIGLTGQAPADLDAALSLADTFCQKQGERLTPIRRKVLALLLTSGRATKAYTLLDEMRKVHPGSAPPTVYRALDFLLSVGLIHRVESINAFAACHDLTHCHHGMLLVCQQCGAVSEMHEPELERVLLDKIQRSGYRLASDAAELKGVCPECQASEASASAAASVPLSVSVAGSTAGGASSKSAAAK